MSNSLIAAEAAGADETMSFATPANLTNFRMNVGIRTLSQGATLMVRHFSPDGEWLTDWSIKEYPPDYFEQVSLQTFIGGEPVAGGSVEVLFVEGSAIVYASTTDNRTNDSSVTILSRPLQARFETRR